MGVAVFIVHHFVLFSKPGTRNNFLMQNQISVSTKNSLYIRRIQMWENIKFKFRHTPVSVTAITHKSENYIKRNKQHSNDLYS